jgi:hypothetical protein
MVMAGLIGCDDGTASTSSVQEKALIIENIPDEGLGGEKALVLIFSAIPEGWPPSGTTAVGQTAVSGTRLNVSLTVPREDHVNASEKKWTGSGDFYILLVPINGTSYVSNLFRAYTNGGQQPEKVSITSKTTTLDFSKFAVVSK